jgi:hypothetical protein
MTKLSFFILLILMNSTPSLEAQSSDTTRCYGVTDLRKIAVKLTEGQECDTLLKLSEIQLQNRDTTIIILNKSITGLKTESSLKESIISRKQQEIDTINLQLKKTKRQLWWTKAGWISTSVALTVGIGYFAFR